MLMIEPDDHKSLKGNFTIRIEMPEKVEFLGVELASECLNWLNVLRKAKKTMAEIERTKDKIIRRNIDPIVRLYLHKQGKKLEQVVENDFKLHTNKLSIKKDPVSSILEALSKAQTLMHEVT